MPARKVRFGIIGCGMIAHVHANAIMKIKDAELVGVYNANASGAAAFAEKYNVRVFDSMEDLSSSDTIDAVCICTPSGLHARDALMVIEKGKHVAVEKPMCINLADADRIIEAADKYGSLVCVISQLRFSKTIQAIRQAIIDGAFGKIVSGSLSMNFYRAVEYYNSSSWKGTWAMDGGGALMNQGIHGVDILLYLMGNIKQLSAFTRCQTRPIETEDSAVAALEFENGAVGTIEAYTTCYPGYPRRLTICGDKGSVVLEEDAIVRWDLPIPAPDEIAAKEDSKVASDPRAVNELGHFCQLFNFVESILYGTPLVVDAREGRKPIEAILSIYNSSKTGEIVVLR